MKSRLATAALYAAVPALILAAWWLAAECRWVEPVFLPRPAEVWATAQALWSDGALQHNTAASSRRIFAGFFATFCLAFPVGVAMGLSPTGRRLFEPINSLFRYMPFPAFVPLLILWFGIGVRTQIAVIFVGTFFQLTVLIQDAFTGIPAEYLETARSLSFSPLRTFLRVQLPAALPQCYDAVRVGIGWAWTCLIVAEMVGADDGLGHLIVVGQRFLKTPQVFVGIFTIGLVGLVIDAVLRALRPLVVPWAPATR